MKGGIITEAVLVPIIIAMILIIVCLAIRVKEYSKLRTLHDLVVWCVTNKMDVYSHSMPLYSYIANAQIKMNVQSEYRISGSNEWDMVKDILTEFQKELTQDYFSNNLKIVKSKYVIPGEQYFMFALTSFLEGHQCDHDFQGNDMYKDRMSYKRYGDWGGPCYDATYSLTDFALVYNKLYYVAYLFCKNSKIFNSNGKLFQNEKHIKDILDSKQIKISRY